ncbi:uncharacterized protein Dwil_GK18862 [Drosophila willistoni]|uniref:Uncharacterized protein n=1 Tax=Drosophila willistoni TaxID=7260 RepID=B4NCG6_DROWI|nr:uncharacterized protein LOC124460428 [Drosophila willistoni]EDW82525.1 uncharacterized protein Dwil_GK18862 [Drosophila willistoni]
MQRLEGLLAKLLCLHLTLAIFLHSLGGVESRSLGQAARSIQIIKNIEDEPIPMTYQFITDHHQPTTLGQNYYIKPGQLVGSFNLDSGILNVRHQSDGKKPIKNKHNILFVAYGLKNNKPKDIS